MSGARSFTEKMIRQALKRGLGALAKRYNVDETYVEYVIGIGPRAKAPAPIPERDEAGAIDRILDLSAIPSKIHAGSRGGWFVYVPKIVGAP